jgi:Fe-S-cluster containining protein
MKRNINKPLKEFNPMKTNTTLKVCQKCKSSCCKFGGADFSKVEMQKVLESGYPDYFVKINENHYEMKSRNRICPYLKKNNSCLIHKIRPAVCKSFPVYVKCNNNKTDFFLISCPLSKVLTERDVKYMKNIAESVKQIITTTFSSSKLPKSDLELIEKRFNKFKIKKLSEAPNRSRAAGVISDH